jgi:tetratricopeptide (TPR) repeat protein
VQYLDLMEALAAGEVVGHLQFLTEVQGRPESALREAELYDQAFFHGVDPQIMAARLRAMDGVEAQGAGSGNTRLLHAQKVELAKKILSWDSAQTRATADAFLVDAQHGIRNGFAPRGVRIQIQDADASLFDFPGRAVWSMRVASTVRDDVLQLALQRLACRDFIGDVWMCTGYLERLREKMGEQTYRNEIAQLLEPRFAGSAARVIFLSDLKAESGDIAGAEALLKQVIASAGDQIGIYSALGALQLRDGRYEEAAKTYLEFPGLKENPSNTVELSNYLEPAARQFLEHGALPQARQLFSIAAAYRDGSYDNLSAVAQLALMDGRFELARDVLQAQYRRYQEHNGMRKLVSLLFMMGRTREAWSALAASSEQGDSYYVSVIGLRMANADHARMPPGARRMRIASTIIGPRSGVCSVTSPSIGPRLRCARSTRWTCRRGLG